MVSSLTSLLSFVESVPCCLVSTRLTDALAILGQRADTTAAKSHDRLVLVNEQHQAIGWVGAQRLLHHLVAAGMLSHLSNAQTPSQQKYSALTGDLPLLDIAPSIVEPVLVLAADLAIDAFLPQFQQQPQACYALADAEGRFLGVLNSSQLLHFLTTHSTPLAAPVHPALQTTDPPPSCVLPANPLLHDLLEHLPLPVMLQTHAGKVLAQNSLWRSQISELLDPTCLRQDVATLLEMPLAEPSMVGVQATSRRLWSSLESSSQSPAQNDAWEARSHLLYSSLKAQAETAYAEVTGAGDDMLEAGLGAESSLPLRGSSCQLGSKPGTCICVCPLKDGQEQILQFVRVPLSQLSAQAAFGLGDRAQTLAPPIETPLLHEPASSSQLFRLAALLSTLHDEMPTVQHPNDVQQGDIDWPERDRLAADRITEPAVSNSEPTSEELWLVLAQDVTEQQQLARELTAKNADLIQLNRLKDEFLACISHELRTPLTAVLGLSSLLKDQMLGALNQRQIHYAQLIYQSGRHLMAVVNDILDLTRIETGQLELVLEPVELETVCQRAFAQAQQLQLQESQPGTELEPQPRFSLTLEPGLGLLMADEQRLRQMLAHLLSNALKFTEPNDPIGLKVGHWGGWIALTVWDTGIGIPAEKQHLIFQKFQQLENPLTRRFEGTGLGLVLTQRLARLHGGDVTFISKEGEGSQFTILLPPNLPGDPSRPKGIAETSLHGAVPQSREAARSDQERSPSTIVNSPFALPASESALDISAFQRSQLVLIVEAVPQSIEMLSDELAGLGYRVVIARAGTEALEKARRLQPCLIFLNPVLPLLSGWDVLTLLKASLETQQIPVVMMATKVDEEEARQRQADHLLSLPIQAKQLQKCLQQLVVDRQEAAHRPRAVVLTVLRLNPGMWASQHQPIAAAALDALLHSCQHRILEADDLEQAELLARIWKPNVVLLNGTLADAASYFRLYCQHIFLASLPLVTIDQATSQAANQAKGLLVFPCLSAAGTLSTIEPKMASAPLLQVIQIAAGYAWRPLVLALDALTLPMSLEIPRPHNTATHVLDSYLKETEWLQALIQYLHTADLRGSVGRCWQEVFQQLESHSVDVLLLCWTDAIAQSFTVPMLTSLQSLHKRPPILVLDHRHHYRTPDSNPIAPLPEVLQQLATNILPASLPMTELLHQIHLAVKANNR